MKVSNESNINKSKNNFSQINNDNDNFKSFNQEVLNEINYAREKPEEYILKLEDIRNSLQSKNEKFLYIDDIPYIYQNLFSSLENAISFLKAQKKLQKLILSPQISGACEELKKELISNINNKNDKKVNISKNESDKFKERINKYGKTFGENYEIIGYNLLDPEFIILNLILGDDDLSKIGRKIIFNPNIKHIGIDAHFSDKKANNNFHILIFSEDFCDGKDEKLINKYKNKISHYVSKTIVYKTRDSYIGKEDQINLEKKINNIINNAKKYRIKKKSSRNQNKRKNRRNYEEENHKIKNDIYSNYYTHRKNLYLDFDEDDFFETEFKNKWGKVEKDKNFQKRLFTSSTTTENGLNTTIISEIYENRQNGVKKGYFTEQKKIGNYNASWKNENVEKEKRDLTILKDMERREKEKTNRVGKSNYKNQKNLEQSEDYEELPEGAVDIQIKRKNITDSEGNPAVEIIKTITYEDGSVQNIIRRQIVDKE